MYRGAEVAEYTCGYFASSWSPLLFIAPEEYLSYGIGDVHNLTTKPIDPNTSRKEYKIQDHLGNTRVVLDGTGTIAGQYDYEPFGGVLWQSAPTPRLSFIDKEKDKETNLSNFGVRNYSDELGRFTSIDPWWEKYRSSTPYNYVENNPLQLVDPSGKGGARPFEPTNIDGGLSLPIPSMPPTVTPLQIVGGVVSAVLGWFIAEQATTAPIDGIESGGETTGETTENVKERKEAGRDGGKSQHIIETGEDGKTVSKTHQVEKGGEIIHQHQDHVSQNPRPGEKPKLRRFPDEWVKYPEVNKPAVAPEISKPVP